MAFLAEPIFETDITVRFIWRFENLNCHNPMKLHDVKDVLEKNVFVQKKQRKCFGGIIKSCNFALAIKRDSKTK